MNNLWRVKGYYGTREFYQPDELDVQSPLPDARNVLLWKPDIITDEKGEAEVEFFCSDINTKLYGCDRRNGWLRKLRHVSVRV